MTVGAPVPKDLLVRIRRRIARRRHRTQDDVVGEIASSAGVSARTLYRWLSGSTGEPRAIAAASAALDRLDRSPTTGGSRP